MIPHTGKTRTAPHALQQPAAVIYGNTQQQTSAGSNIAERIIYYEIAINPFVYSFRNIIKRCS